MELCWTEAGHCCHKTPNNVSLRTDFNMTMSLNRPLFALLRVQEQSGWWMVPITLSIMGWSRWVRVWALSERSILPRLQWWDRLSHRMTSTCSSVGSHSIIKSCQRNKAPSDISLMSCMRIRCMYIIIRKMFSSSRSGCLMASATAPVLMTNKWKQDERLGWGLGSK